MINKIMYREQSMKKENKNKKTIMDSSNGKPRVMADFNSNIS